MIEKIRLDKDVNVLCVSVKSFPDGIMEAFQKLHALIPFSSKRVYYGISRPNEKGVIGYKAAIEIMDDEEAYKFGSESFVIPKGEYISLLIPDYLKSIPAIGDAFNHLTLQPGIDPEGYCIEWYFNENDVRCMVKLKT